MQDIDCLAAYSVKNSEWIANDCNDTNVGALRDTWGGFGRAANTVDDPVQPTANGISYRGTGAGNVIGRDQV